jgi:ABC-type branched-subunit amino acid transport system ATPase component/ABC-type branched-subunit amino acid transport system permease subunit
VDYLFSIGISILLYIMLGLALNLLMGYAGQLSMAHAAFFGMGAYTAGILTMATLSPHSSSGLPVGLGVRSTGLGWSPALAIPAAMIVAFILASIVSIPAASRIRGEYLILLTMAFQIITNQLMISWSGLTGGPFGLTPIPPITLAGQQLVDPGPFFWFLFVFALATFLLCWRVGESPFGRVLKGIREDERATSSLGKDTIRIKVIIFGISAAIAGLAGALSAFYFQFIAPSTYSFTFAMFIVAVVALGGTGNLLGTVIGAVVLGTLPAVLQNISWIGTQDSIPWQTVIYGLGLAIMMALRPEGILPEGTSIASVLRRSRVSVPPVEDGFSAPATAASGRFASHASSPSREGGEVLTVRGLTKAFGGIVAANKVDLGLRAGQITALIGPNGAGKTTLFNMVTGYLRPDAGRVHLNGEDITGMAPHRIVERGVTRSFQDVRVFQQITAVENVAMAIPGQLGERLGALALRPIAVQRDKRRVEAKAREYLRFVGLESRADYKVSSLSFAEQKMVAIARLLATESAVLLLDEPTSGLDPSAVDRVIQLILRVKELGKTICIVEHSLHVVEQLADLAYFLDQGRVLASGTVAALTSKKELVETYFGA